MKTKTREAAVAHALAEYPNESCGLVVAVGGKEKYVPCKNIATTRSEHFILDPKDYAAAEDMGDIIAVIHSHPNEPARPSEADKVMCEASGVPWYILSVGRNEEGAPYFHAECAIEPSGYEPPLIGREFAFGILDCYALVRDYYRKHLGIELTNYERTDGFWERGENLYMKNLEGEGFYKVDIADIKPGDLIVMQVRSPEPNHGGVYIGNGQFIHHMYDRLSERAVYGGYWLEKTIGIYRHKDYKGVINE